MTDGERRLAELGWNWLKRFDGGEIWSHTSKGGGEYIEELTIAKVPLDCGEPSGWGASLYWFDSSLRSSVSVTEDYMRAVLKRIEELRNAE